MSIFTENLKRILHEKHTTYATMSHDIGISKNGLKYWETNGNIPNVDILSKMAEYLGTDVETLLYGCPQRISLTEDESELLTVFRTLKKSGQRQLIGRAYELQDQQGQVGDKAGIAPPDIDLVTARVVSNVKK